MRFLRDDEALRTIRLFHKASATKGISKQDLEHWVVRLFMNYQFILVCDYYRFIGIIN